MFGLAYFDHIVGRVKWSRKHETYLNIVGGFPELCEEIEFRVDVASIS